MRGQQVLIEPLPAGGNAAALVVDGRLEDLLIDPAQATTDAAPEAIYLARSSRPMKGLGGAMMDLGGGLTGFLRGAAPPPGQLVLVQVTTTAEPGKAPPVSTRILLKGRYALLSPGAPGRNVARSIANGETREALTQLADTAMAGADPELGLILRSAAATADSTEIAAEIARLRHVWDTLRAFGTDAAPGLRRAAPGAAETARRDWLDRHGALREAAHALEDAGIWEEVAALRRPEVTLGPGTMTIEPTRALTAVDVNTGGDLSPAAALKANLAAARELPRQLRLRGIGGQIAIDFAPLAKPDRRRIENALSTALRADGIDTIVAGWTPLGHLELQRKRLRRPLSG